MLLRRNVLMGAALALLGMAAACAVFASRTITAVNDFQEQVDRLEAIEGSGDVLLELRGDAALDEMRRLRGLTIPASASDGYFAWQGSVPAYYWMRFAVSPDAANSLFSSCFESTPEAGYNPDFAYDASPDVIASLDWWMPDATQAYAGAECSPQSGVRATALVDQSDPAQWTIYLEVVSE